MKSVLFTTHHPKLLFTLGKWLFVKLECRILSHYLSFLSKIKADLEFSNENKSEAFLILSVLSRMCSLPGKKAFFLLRPNWQLKLLRTFSSLLFLKSLFIATLILLIYFFLPALGFVFHFLVSFSSLGINLDCSFGVFPVS